MLVDRRRRQRAVGDDEGGDRLAEGRIWRADDGALGQSVELEQRLLDLGRVHVEPGAVDDVDAPVDEEDEALVVAYGDVAGVIPAVDESATAPVEAFTAAGAP